ncbi:MAG: hypothetical protein HYX74_11220, partial [Acidobacteria bacterium]|nr:hypothetical protein [Acidobacteriota bacterium]
MTPQRPVYLLAPVRTPAGRRGGILRSLSAVELGVAAVRGALHAAELSPQKIDQLIFGIAAQAGTGPNLARQVGVGSGIPARATAYTVNNGSASGLQAIVSAARIVQLGEGSCLIAGGIESASNVPYLLPRRHYGTGEDSPPVDALSQDVLDFPLLGKSEAEAAEALARQYSLDTAAQDRCRAESLRRFRLACREGRFATEIVPLRVSENAVVRLVEEDEWCLEVASAAEPADDQAPAAPVEKEGAGSRPASGRERLCDGAAALVVAGSEGFDQIRRLPACRITAYATVGVAPSMTGLALAPAIKDLLSISGVTLPEVDLLELGQVSAASLLACAQELKLDLSRV